MWKSLFWRPKRTQWITGSAFPISFHPHWQISYGFFNWPIMAKDFSTVSQTDFTRFLPVAQATSTCRIILFTNISDKLFNMKYCLFSQHYSHITEELPVPRCPLLHGCKLTGSGVWKLLWWVPWRVVPLVHDGPGSLGSLAFQRLQKEW